MTNHYPNLNPEKALIWRIVHRDNLAWILDNGLHCASSQKVAEHYEPIGNTDLIHKRTQRNVPIEPYGTLSDYIPFYFTPFSPMMYNIHTGRGGVKKRANEEIVILVSSIPKLIDSKVPFVFTDRHAYTAFAEFFDNSDELIKLDWPIIQQRNFQRNQDDPAQIERYQAEALVYKHCPITSLLGIVCYTDEMKQQLEQIVKEKYLAIDVRKMTQWYFQ